MTSRPKRRQGELGVELSDERADEYFRLIGTPSQSLEKSKELGEYIPPWKQEVRDEKGRRRLHGAFTGGFSAGYFNTVGSKEGWTPQTFVSSRSERAMRKVARPEDFMDEEDIAVLREEQDELEKEEEMEVLEAARAEMNNRESVGGDQRDFVSSAREVGMSSDSVGARLLQKMVQQADPDTSSLPASTVNASQDLKYTSTSVMSESENYRYSLRDITTLQAEKKGNVRGLGYIPDKTPKEKVGAKQSTIQGPRLAVGFGLGALNDAEDDDLDIYDRPQESGQSRLAYDASHPESKEINKSKTEKATTASFHRSTEETGVLSGFVPSDQPSTEESSYLSPEAKREDEHAQVLNKFLKPDGSSSEATLPGEASAPVDPSSVFHYVSQKDRERLKTITAQIPTKDGPPTQSCARTIVAPDILMPFTEPHIAQAAIRGFQPFAADPVKQARYHTYLQSQAFPGSEPLTPLPNQKMDEFRKELESYAKASQLFKPMSGAMANRFTSAVVVDHNQRVNEGLHRPSAADLARKVAPPSVQKVEESPKAQAARMGMYGPLTREMKPWQPARLLCKRFGVKDPNPGPEPSTPSNSNAKTMPSGPSSSTTPMSRATSSGVPTVGFKQSTSSNGETHQVERTAMADGPQVQAQPSVDIYNAIFAGEEISDDEAQDSSNLNDNDGKQTKSARTEPPSSTIASGPGQSVMATPDKIDLNVFKPTFVPRSEREKKSSSKKDKKKGGKAVLVSFELDDESGGHSQDRPNDRPKKKRKRKRDKGDENEVVWSDKVSPETTKEVIRDPPPNSSSTEPTPVGTTTTPPKGRKRAIDFM